MNEKWQLASTMVNENNITDVYITKCPRLFSFRTKKSFIREEKERTTRAEDKITLSQKSKIKNQNKQEKTLCKQGFPLSQYIPSNKETNLK